MKQKNKIAQIKWACRRGMLELDFILNEFLANGFLKLSEVEHDDFLIFLENSDPDLYAWLMGFKQAEKAQDIKMVDNIRDAQ